MTRYCIAAMVLVGFGFAAVRAGGPIEADILLTGATIYDGTGGAPVRGDVAMRGDRIVAVGSFEVERVVWEIDCRQLVIAPGFIDLHTHSDEPIASGQARANVNYLIQGSTTVVTGNCGSGPADVGAFYEKVKALGAGTNVVHLLPQGALRKQVMGTEQRSASPEELAAMKKLVAKAMNDGAWGMSTGLIYVPSSYADTDELVELAKVVAAHRGIYVSHIRNEGTGLLEAVEEALEIGRRAQVPVHISHFKSAGRGAWGLVRRAVERIEQARAAGQRVTADQYPYIGSSTSLDAMLIPTWARAGTRKAMVARLDDPEAGPKMVDAIAAALQRRDNGQALQVASFATRRDWQGKNLAEIAAAEKKTPLEIALEIVRHGGASMVNFCMNEDDVRYVMQRPWVATASDGRAYLPAGDRPHPRSYGAFARKIGYYAIRQNVLPLGQAIRSASGLPADILGLPDRGYIKTGAFADVVVFDPKQYIDRATFDAPHRYAAGVRYVFVNGQPAVFEGIPTGALAGRALRHPHSCKAKQ